MLLLETCFLGNSNIAMYFETLTSWPLTNIIGVGRLVAPWPPDPWLTLAAWAGCHPQCPCEVRFSQTTVPLLEPRDSMTYPHSKDVYVTDCGCQVTRTSSVPGCPPEKGVTYDAKFAIADQMSCRVGTLLFIFPTASTKLCFITCCQTLSLFEPQTLSR